jgi:hypothetical protein
MFRWQAIRTVSAICVCVSLPGRAATVARPDVTVTIEKGVRQRLLLAHVSAAASSDGIERVTANGVAMEPGSPFRATRCTVDRPSTLAREASNTFWLDLDAVDPTAFIDRPVVVAVSTDAASGGGFVSVVAELVTK